MQSFRSAQSRILKRCARSRQILLLFDFDGTLSPIVEQPWMARMNEDWRKRLTRLHKRRDVTVGIVTGRTLPSIRTRVKVPNMIYAAVHGCEIAKGKRLLLTLGREYRKPFAMLTRELNQALRGISGAQVEYKDIAVAIHFRRAKPADRRIIKRRATAVVEPWLEEYDWQLTKGKMFLEVRTAKRWNKGHAVRWIWKHLAPGALPCYIGDDLTDEDAFRALGKRGITIRIGKVKDSAAQYYIKDIDELIPWLDSI